MGGLAVGAVLLIAFAACDDATGPTNSGGVDTQFSEDIGFEEFQQMVTAGSPLRLEIKLAAGGPPYRARRVEIEEPEELSEREEVKSRITDLQLQGGSCAGSLSVAIEGIDVRIANHPFIDNLFERAEALARRQPEEGHTYVAPEAFYAWIDELITNTEESLE